MTLPALYELAAEYRQAQDRLADLDLDEQTIADTLDSLSGALEEKAQNVAMFIRNLEATSVAIKEAEGRMAARRKAIENRADRLKQYLLENMQFCEIREIECSWFKISVRENPPAVVVDAADLIPAEFMRQPEPPPPAPDKTAIAKALKSGQDVPGVHLMRGVRLDIK
jgi:hypothetical protein